jgi:hypothetical protein
MEGLAVELVLTSPLQRQIRHSGKLRELSARHPGYAALSDIQIPTMDARCWDRSDGTRSYDVQAIFIGKTGYGKSSTVNALFDQGIMGTSAVGACTREAQCFEFKVRENNYLAFTDLPGIGESEQRDLEYLPLYAEIAKTADAIIYMMRADTRDHSVDEKTFDILFPDRASRRNLIIGLNFCDKVEPLSRSSLSPTPAQLANIREKMDWIGRRFRSGAGIVAFSADSRWNIDILANEISQVMIRSLRA